LFAEFGSPPAAAAETVSVMTVPGVVAEPTFVTSEKVAGEFAVANVASVQIIEPVDPTNGKVGHVQPDGIEGETKVVLLGMVSVNVALAVFGPLFVTTCVNVRLFPGSTGFGEAVLLMARSDCPAPATTTVAVA